MQRKSVCLNGLWDFMPLEKPEPPQSLPEGFPWERRNLERNFASKISVPSSWRWSLNPKAAFQPYDLFDYPLEWNAYPAGFISRRFQVDVLAGSRAWLVFQGVLQSSAFFVNGHPIASSNEGFLPIELDVTDVVRPGENELVVWCGPWERVPTPTGEKVLVPSGSWFAGLARGIWQDVFLETRPDVYLGDAAVRTSTRQEAITIEAMVENRSEVQFEGFVQAHVMEAGSVAKTFQPVAVSLLPGERRTVQWQESWMGAQWWSPEKPYLYELALSLTPAPLPGGEGELPPPSGEGWGEGGDRKILRFGFREVWFEDHRLYLNGVRTNLRGDAWHYQGFAFQTSDYARNWYRVCKQTGMNFVRLHAMPYPEFFLDIADEEGFLIVDESAIYGSGKGNPADDPRFLDACRTHLESLVRRDRNHPSVIIWSMQNEMRWVDGRDGYREAMPGLTRLMKSLDPTRPVSYDGDNRLVPADWCEIISMHYNIDGTVASWNKEKPLIFGEHGAYHYISPQTCTDLAGPQAYISFEHCLESIGENERLFIEYARREEVTGLTPFNLVNYSHWTFPAEDIPLHWENLETAGPKPVRVRAHSLTINNGLATGDSLNIPNPAYAPVAQACKPATVIPDELDRFFYGGEKLRRSFSIYNDTETPAQVRVSWRLTDARAAVLDQGEIRFTHPPGERIPLQIESNLPEPQTTGQVLLELDLFQAEKLVHHLGLEYKVAPSSLKATPCDTRGKRIFYLGERSGYDWLSSFVPDLIDLRELKSTLLQEAELLIVGPFYSGRADDNLHLLKTFVEKGGCLLVLEQDQFTLGETALSGRKFFSAFMNPPDHPFFTGLAPDDFLYWTPDNPHSPNWRGLVDNAFYKPVQGNFEILLECGEGYFGWGGLLWTPLVSYEIGKGKAVISQLALQANFEKTPQACLLLRNMIESLAARAQPVMGSLQTWLLSRPDSPSEEFLRRIGLNFSPLNIENLPVGSCGVVDPDALTTENLGSIQAFVSQGGRILMLPAQTGHQPELSRLTGAQVLIEQKDSYQLAPEDLPAVYGLTCHDLYRLERATYTPATFFNRPIAGYSIRIPEAVRLLQTVKNPWKEYFLEGLDGEPVKMAIATMNLSEEFQPTPYALNMKVGAGEVVFSQVNLDGADKSIRIYSRLLANLGADLHNSILEMVRKKSDFAIERLMVQNKEPHHDLAAMTAYYTDPNFLLNNLGEGVYGWMKHLDRRDGFITVPNSAGQICFLTVFVDSEINRDPSQRETNVLPDSSIVPDLFLDINAPFQLYVNGVIAADYQSVLQETFKVEYVLLRKGINRLVLVCQAGDSDLRLNAWFLNRYGDPVSGLRYLLTLD